MRMIFVQLLNLFRKIFPLLHFGAEFTKEYVILRGGKIIPKEYAVIVEDNAKETPAEEISSDNKNIPNQFK